MVRKKINVAILMAALTVSMLAGCGSQKDKQEVPGKSCALYQGKGIRHGRASLSDEFGRPDT